MNTYKQLLSFVEKLNEVSGAINLEKIRFDVTEGTGEEARKIRYYIQQRPVFNKDGVEDWRFVARKWNGK